MEGVCVTNPFFLIITHLCRFVIQSVISGGKVNDVSPTSAGAAR